MAISYIATANIGLGQTQLDIDLVLGHELLMAPNAGNPGTCLVTGVAVPG